jgi:hypothetical protein
VLLKNHLDFYFEVTNVLNRGNLLIGLQKSDFKEKLLQIILSFTDSPGCLNLKILWRTKMLFSAP